MNKHEIIIFWSDDDQVFIADVPELPGCMAHGNTYETALANAREVVALWIETANEFGDTILTPKGRRLSYAWLIVIITVKTMANKITGAEPSMITLRALFHSAGHGGLCTCFCRRSVQKHDEEHKRLLL